MASKKKSDLTYTNACTELEAILDEIETGNADIDVLGEKVERASELIKHCRETLSGTELRVQRVVDELAAQAGTDAAEGSDDGEEQDEA